MAKKTKAMLEAELAKALAEKATAEARHRAAAEMIEVLKMRAVVARIALDLADFDARYWKGRYRNADAVATGLAMAMMTSGNFVVN